MNWYSETVRADALDRLLAVIRGSAGTIIRCTPVQDFVQVTWTVRN